MTKKRLIALSAVAIPLLFILYVVGYFTYHYGYWTDRNGVYYSYFNFNGDFKKHCDTLKNADIRSFEKLDNFWAKDKNHLYHCGKTTRLDVNSFEFLERHLIRDSAGIHYLSYQNDDILLGTEVDIPTFEWLEETSTHSIAVDKHRVYIVDETRQCDSYELANPLVPINGSRFFFTDSVSVFSIYGRIDGADPEKYPF